MPTKHLDNVKLPAPSAKSLDLKAGSTLTADRSLTFLTDDQDRVLDLRTGGIWGYNHLANGGLWLAQRQDPSTATTIAQDGYGPDRWRSCRENADLKYFRTADTNGDYYYGTYRKITNAGKFLVVQILEAVNTFPLQSRVVTFACRLSANVAKTVRLGLIQLTSAGTIDTIPANIVPTTWGSTGTDPTLGTNLAYITPASVPTNANGTINSNAVDCSVTTGWQIFGGTFTMPSDCKNVMVALWTDAQFSVNDQLNLGRLQLVDGGVLRDWLPMSMAFEIERCQPYYEKSYDLDTAPGNVNDLGPCICPQAGAALAGTTAGNTGQGILLPFKVTKRVPPTVVLYDYDGTANAVRVYPADAKRSGVTAVANLRASGCAQYITFDNSSATAITSTSTLNAHFTAECEL